MRAFISFSRKGGTGVENTVQNGPKVSETKLLRTSQEQHHSHGLTT